MWYMWYILLIISFVLYVEAKRIRTKPSPWRSRITETGQRRVVTTEPSCPQDLHPLHEQPVFFSKEVLQKKSEQARTERTPVKTKNVLVHRKVMQIDAEVLFEDSRCHWYCGQATLYMVDDATSNRITRSDLRRQSLEPEFMSAKTRSICSNHKGLNYAQAPNEQNWQASKQAWPSFKKRY